MPSQTVKGGRRGGLKSLLCCVNNDEAEESTEKIVQSGSLTHGTSIQKDKQVPQAKKNSQKRQNEPTSIESDKTPEDDKPVPVVHTNDDIWTEAYKRLDKDLVSDLEAYLGGKIDDSHVRQVVKDKLSERDSKQWVISISNHDIKIRDQVDRLLKFASWSDSLVKNALSSQPIAGLAWSAVSITLPLLTNATAQHAIMLSGYNSVCSTQRLYRLKVNDIVEQQKLRPEVVREVLKLYTKIVEYQARTICHLASVSIKRAWKSLVGSVDWESLKKDVDQLDTYCEKFFDESHQKAILDSFAQETEEIRISIKIQDDIRRISAELLENQRQIREDDKTQKLLDSLYVAYEVGKNSAGERVKGTCEWFLGVPGFARFRDSPGSQFLWYSGDPECGKSVLARYLVDDQLLRTTLLTTTVCYYFFHDEDREHDGASALKSLLHQLLTSPATRNRAFMLLQRQRSFSVETYWDTLLEISEDENSGEIVCVLDGLDECEESSRSKLRQKIISFCQDVERGLRRTSRLKLFVTGRPLSSLNRRFETSLGSNKAYAHIDSQSYSDAIAKDIDLFIDGRVLELYPDWPDSERAALSSHLRSLENRTYLWLDLTFRLMDKSPSRYEKLSTAKEAMLDMPTDVADAYEKMLNKSTDTRYARHLLELMLASEEPLSLDEINVAMTLLDKVPRSLSDLDLWEPKRFPGFVQETCGFFINVHDSKLFFIHKTARKFLLRDHENRDLRDNIWKESFSFPSIYGTLAQVSVEYLALWEKSRHANLFPSILTGSRPENGSERGVQADRDTVRSALIGRASYHWAKSLTRSSTEQKRDLAEKAHSICDPSAVTRDGEKDWWFQTFNIHLASREQTNIAAMDPKQWSELGVACAVGSIEVVERWIKTSPDPGKTMDLPIHGRSRFATLRDTGDGQSVFDTLACTALEVAIQFHQPKVVEVLLQRGATTKARANSEDATSPLWQAAEEEDIEVVRVLVENGADVNELHEDYGSGETTHILLTTARLGSIDLLSLVIEKCDKNLKKKWLNQAVSAAIIGEKEAREKVELLHGHGADLNALSEESNCPLACAAESGDVDVLEFLIDMKVDVRAQGTMALMAAASKGDLLIFRALVEKFNIELQDEIPQHAPFESFQEAAAYGGNVDIMHTVGHFDSGEDGEGTGPAFFRFALGLGHLSVVKALIEEYHLNANTRFLDTTGVEAAANSGNVNLLRYLLLQGADPSGVESNIVLRLADSGGIKAAQSFLEDKSLDPKRIFADDQDPSPLEMAAGSSSPDVVQFVLDYGVSVHSQGPKAFKATLMRFVIKGPSETDDCHSIIENLLKYGMDPNAVLEDRCLLQWAANYSVRDVISLLVSHGADVKRFGTQAIRDAITAEYSTEQDIRQTVKLLISKGADPAAEILGEKFKTAAELAEHRGLPEVIKELSGDSRGRRD